MLHGLGDSELHEHLTAEGQHHDKEREPATGIAHSDGPVGTPVDLRALAPSEGQLQIDRPFGRADAAQVIAQDRYASAISLLTQTLEYLLSAIRVGVQQPHDARLEGIKDTAPRPAAPRLEARPRHPRGDRLWIKAQRPGGLRDGQALAIMAVMDLGKRLVIDHGQLRSQARGVAARAADVARMSWPSRSKRPVVRTMSSCTGVPTI